MKIDPEVAKDVSDLILLHQVHFEEGDTRGDDIARCFMCGYFGNEDPTLHTANVVLEYVEEYYKERFGES